MDEVHRELDPLFRLDFVEVQKIWPELRNPKIVSLPTLLAVTNSFLKH